MKYSTRDLMDIAYDVAKENFGKISFNFAALWAKTWAKAKEFKKDSIENWIGAFYTELLIDPRFVYVGTHKWRLREFMDYGEYLREIGKRAQDTQFSEIDIGEGDTKEKVEVKKRATRKKKDTLIAASEVESFAETISQDSSEEKDSDDEEEINLDEDLEESTSMRQVESEDDEEDSYE